jgi:hypothetical protein
VQRSSTWRLSRPTTARAHFPASRRSGASKTGSPSGATTPRSSRRFVWSSHIMCSATTGNDGDPWRTLKWPTSLRR